MEVIMKKLANRKTKSGWVIPICVGLRDASPEWIEDTKNYLRSRSIKFEHRVEVKGTKLSFNGVLYIK